MPINKSPDIFIDLARALSGHDWYYAMSDDPRVFQKGEDRAAHIKFLMRKAKEVDADRSYELYCQYAPHCNVDRVREEKCDKNCYKYRGEHT